MKKNAMLKIAAILMVAVLLTTCAISSTFAKYTTSGSDDVEARVARFGVNVTTNIDKLFAKEYGAKTTAPNVISAGDDNVVAPGTSNSLTLKSFATGTPEVSVVVKNKVTLELTGWQFGEENNQTKWCPLVFTVNGMNYSIDYSGENKESTTTHTYVNGIDELVAAVNAAATREQVYAAGKNLAENTDDAAVTTISWAWAFDNGNDTNDTALGNLATAKVKFTLTTTIDQYLGSETTLTPVTEAQG